MTKTKYSLTNKQKIDVLTQWLDYLTTKIELNHVVSKEEIAFLKRVTEQCKNQK